MFEEEKRRMRQTYLALREALRRGEAEPFAANVLAAFGEAKSFFVYLSVGSEVPTGGVIKSLLSRGKRVCVPRVANGRMASVPLTDKLVRGAFGIPQPPEGEEETCEVALVPLLAADPWGNRLGYGGGYYDRYFAEHGKVLRAGLCFFGQIAESVPHGAGDVPLDALVTERGTFRLTEEGRACIITEKRKEHAERDTQET